MPLKVQVLGNNKKNHDPDFPYPENVATPTCQTSYAQRLQRQKFTPGHPLDGVVASGYLDHLVLLLCCASSLLQLNRGGYALPRP